MTIQWPWPSSEAFWRFLALAVTFCLLGAILADVVRFRSLSATGDGSELPTARLSPVCGCTIEDGFDFSVASGVALSDTRLSVEIPNNPWCGVVCGCGDVALSASTRSGMQSGCLWNFLEPDLEWDVWWKPWSWPERGRSPSMERENAWSWPISFSPCGLSSLVGSSSTSVISSKVTGWVLYLLPQRWARDFFLRNELGESLWRCRRESLSGKWVSKLYMGSWTLDAWEAIIVKIDMSLTFLIVQGDNDLNDVCIPSQKT